MAVDTVALRQVKNQRVVMKAGLYIHTACIPALTYFRLCNIMPPPTDAIWTDSMLCASPCAGNEMHCMQPLSRTIVACVLQLPSPVEAYSELCWQLSLCTRSVCRPSTLRCQRLSSKWRNVLSVPYSSGDALHFSSALASLEQGHRIKNLSANNGKWAFLL